MGVSLQPLLDSLKGKGAAITGGSRGLGRFMALGLAASGAKVAVGARKLHDCEETAAEIRRDGGVAFGCSIDVSDRQSCASFVARTVAELGSIDVMICNAGICVPIPALDTDVPAWQRTIDIDLTGAFNSAVEAGREMVRAGRGGSIVMTSSTGGAIGFDGLAAYCAAKGGVNQLVRSLALEWGPHGIRVNGVAPGWTNHLMEGNDALTEEAIVRQAIERTPLRRFGEPEEIVAPTLFLASSAASFITGTVLTVDGGHTAV